MQQIRTFMSFSLFYLSTSVVFWPLVVIAAFTILMAPMFLYWQFDMVSELRLLVAGAHMPAYDWSLSFLIPALILSFPVVYAYHDCQFLQEQVDMYTFLSESISTTYGIIGWALTVVFLVGFFSFCLWAVRHTLDLSDRRSSNYLAVLTVIITAIVLYK